MARKALIAFPDGMLEKMDYVAEQEHRTRSDLVREAVRRYLDNFSRSQRPAVKVSSVEPYPVAE